MKTYSNPGQYPASRLYDVIKLLEELRIEGWKNHELTMRALLVVKASLESIKDDLCFDCTYNGQDVVHPAMIFRAQTTGIRS